MDYIGYNYNYRRLQLQLVGHNYRYVFPWHFQGGVKYIGENPWENLFILHLYFTCNAHLYSALYCAMLLYAAVAYHREEG